VGDASNASPGAETGTDDDDELPDLPLNLNWTLILTAIIAFVLGLGVGGFAEHEHTKSSNKKHTAASGTPTTVGPSTGSKTPIDSAGWFGAKVTTACPGLRIWAGEQTARRDAFAKTTTWKTKSGAVLRIDKPITEVYTALLPMATATGKPEIQLLLTTQGKLDAALTTSTKPDDYSKVRKTVSTAQVTTDIGILSKVAASCPT
jgi:hypothetical protein